MRVLADCGLSQASACDPSRSSLQFALRERNGPMSGHSALYPASCYSHSLRQQATPLSKTSFCGSASRQQSLLPMRTVCRSARAVSTRGRPKDFRNTGCTACCLIANSGGRLRNRPTFAFTSPSASNRSDSISLPIRGRDPTSRDDHPDGGRVASGISALLP